MLPQRFEKSARVLFVLLCSLAVMGCISWGQAFVLSFANLQRLADDTFGPPKNVTVALTETAHPEIQGETVSSQPTSEVAPPRPLGNVLACDALPYVKVEVAERNYAYDKTSCAQNMSITNTHPDKSIWVIGHLGVSNEGEVLGEFQDFLPQEQGNVLWSFWNTYPGRSTLVDWYVAVFSVPECMWIIEEYVQSDFHSTRIVELPALGLAVQYVDVPSCIP